MVTPLGIGVHANWSSLLQGRSGVTELLPEHLPAEQHLARELPSRVIGAVDSDALEAAMRKVSLDTFVSLCAAMCCHVSVIMRSRCVHGTSSCQTSQSPSNHCLCS